MYQRGVGVAEGSGGKTGSFDGRAFPDTKEKKNAVYRKSNNFKCVMGKCKLFFYYLGREGVVGTVLSYVKYRTVVCFYIPHVTSL